jgi:hypothetical protein
LLRQTYSCEEGQPAYAPTPRPVKRTATVPSAGALTSTAFRTPLRQELIATPGVDFSRVHGGELTRMRGVIHLAHPRPWGARAGRSYEFNRLRRREAELSDGRNGHFLRAVIRSSPNGQAADVL